MACPTCGNAEVQFVAQNERGDNFHHCPRCGTLTMDAFGLHGDEVFVPALVRRCRELADAPHIEPQYGKRLLALFQVFGITDAIRKPGERP